MRPELDHILAVNKELLAIFELANRVVADRLKSRPDIVSFNRITQLSEFIDDVANLLDHKITGEVAVNLGDFLELPGPMLNGCQDAFRGTMQGRGALILLLQQLHLARLKSIVDLVTFLNDLGDVVIKLSKLPFQFLELDHGPGKVTVALVRRIAEIEEVDDRLAQQLHLRAELGLPFLLRQLETAILQDGTNAVELRIDRRDIVDDLSRLGRILDPQVADNINQHLELGTRLIEFVPDSFGLSHFGHAVDPGFLLGDAVAVGIECLVPQGGIQRSLLKRAL